MIDAARRNDRVLRVMENYLFYEPLHATAGDGRSRASSATISGYHMKMVGSGRGGWDVPISS